MGLLDTPWLDSEQPVDDSSAFTKGLRSGVLGLRSQATTALGGIVDALASGYQTADPNGPEVPGKRIARELYESGRGLALDAAAAAPPVGSYKDVHDLRSGYDYVTGLVGQSLPTVVPAVAGALIAKRPIVGSTAALAVPEAGDVIQRQQDAAQPVENMAVGDLARSAAGGLGSAAVQSIVPAATAAKLAGRTAATAAKNTGKELAMRSAAAIPVEGAAEAGGEAIKEVASGQPIDSQAILEAGVGGAVAGGAMGAVGGVGEALHGAASRAGTTVGETLTDAGARAGEAVRAAGDRISGLVEKARVGGEAAKERAGLFMRDAEARFKTIKDAEGNAEVVDTSVDLTDADAVAKSDASTTEWAKTKLKGWIDDAGLDQETRAKANDLLGRVGEPAARIEIASMALARKARERADDFYTKAQEAFGSAKEAVAEHPAATKVRNMLSSMERGEGFSVPAFKKAVREMGVEASGKLDEVVARVKAEFDKTNTDTKQSADYRGAHAIIAQEIKGSIEKTNPELLEDPESMERIAAGIRSYVEAAKDGHQPEREASVTAYLRMYLGADTIAVLKNVFTKLHKGTAKEREAFFDSLQKYDEDLRSHNAMRDVVKDSLEKGAGVDVYDAVEAMRGYVRGAHLKKNISESERAINEKLAKDEITKVFGKKADKVIAAFQQEFESINNKTSPEDEVEGEDKGAAPDADEATEATEAEMQEAGLAETELEQEKPVYLGSKTGLKLIPTHKEHARLYGNQDSQAKKLLAEAREKYPDRNVSFMSAKDYAEAEGIAFEELLDKTNYEPHKYGIVVVEGSKAADRITQEEAKAMRLESKSRGESPSRINTTKPGVTLDAHKITLKTLYKMDYIEGEAPIQRIARAFYDGLGSALTAFNTTVDGDLPDSLVIFNRKNNQSSLVGPTAEGTRHSSAITLGDIRALAGKDRTRLSIDALMDAESELKDLRRRLANIEGNSDKAIEKRKGILAEMAALEGKLYGEPYKGVTRRDGVVEMNIDPDTEVTNQYERRYQVDKIAGIETEKPTNAADLYGEVERTVSGKDGMKITEHRVGGTRKSNADVVTEAGKKELDPTGPIAEAERLEDSGSLHGAFVKARKSGDTRGKVGVDTEDRADTKRTAGPTAPKAAASEIAEGGDQGGVLAGRDVEDQAKDIVRGASVADATIKALAKEPPIVIKRAIKAINNAKVANKRELRNANNAIEQLNAALGETLKKSPDVAYSLQLTSASEFEAALAQAQEDFADFDPLTDASSPPYPGAKKRNGYWLSRDEKFAAIPAGGYGYVVVPWDAVSTIREKGFGGSHFDRAVGKAFNDLRAGKDVSKARKEFINGFDGLQLTDAEQKEMLAQFDSLTKYSLSPTGQSEVSEKSRKHVEKYIDDVLPRIKVEWAKIAHAGEFTPQKARDVIRLSVHALNPMGTAYHESMHALFKHLRESGNNDVWKVLNRAAESAPVLNQLKALLKGQPEALKQLSDPEERVAYMYQFYAQEKLKLGPDTRNVLQKIKDFIMKVLGMWTNDQRAEHIMDMFHEGALKDKLGDTNAVARALMEPGNNAVIERAKKALAPLRKMEQAILSTGAERLRDTENPALVKLAHMIAPETGSEADDVGFIQAYKNESVQRMNALARKLKGISAEDIQGAHAALKRGDKTGLSGDRLRVFEAVRDHLDDTFKYMRDKTVRVRDLGYKDDYFPRIWDIDYISKHQDEFIGMLNKIIARGDWDGDPNAILKNLLSHDGSELGVVVDMPGMQHTKERKLDFIKPSDAAPFVEKSLLRTLNAYTVQAARRAEWAQRFGDDGAGMRDLLREAKDKHGATQEEIDMAQDFIRSVDGTLGDDISPAMRRIFGNLIVYQNIRLLPLAIFSQVVDPGGILVRGGTFGDAFKAFKRGITEIPRGFKKNKTKDEWYELAETIGAIDDATLAETLGSSYTQGMVSDGARKWNDALFKFNMVEQFTNSMRVSAVEAAVRFIARHGDGKYSEHSTRWMEELGLKPSDVVVKDGKLLVTHDDHLKAGYSEKEALERSNKMKAAVNKWVDGAILRPNAANKPIWMNDPYFALIAHLKQFVYAFQDTILKRAFHEATHGNYGPALALAGYVPMMIAADLVKGMIQGGGEQPQWKKDWGVGQYIHSGIERAGLYGVGQFSADLLHGNFGSISGPTFEQLGDALRVIGGNAQFNQQAMKALPANALYAGFLSGEGSPENTAKFTR